MIHDWKLERYRLGELPADELARVSQALAADPTLRARLEALAADDVATLSAHPVEQVAQRVAARAAQAPKPARSGWRVPALATAAALALGVVALLAVPGAQDADDVRLKGAAPTLRLFRLGAAGPERLDDGAAVRAHDVVQVSVEPAGALHLAVVSVDGAGQATRHWPTGADTRVPPGFKVLPQAFELDATPGFERFVLLTSASPIDVEGALAAVRTAGQDAALALPAGTTQRSFLLRKVSP